MNDDTWAALLKYKIAEDKLNELKLKVWENIPLSADIELSLREAEEDLEELRALIELNYGPMKLD